MNMKNKNIIGTLLLLLITLAIGCISPSETESNVVPVVPNQTELIGTNSTESTEIEPTAASTTIEPTVVVPTTTIVQKQDGIGQSDFLAYTFKVNDEKVMLDRDMQLMELATEEGIAIINVDGDPYKLTYSIEQEIKGRIVKITDIDGINNTVKITVRSI